MREQGVLSLEEAVRKMTSSVAARLLIQDRGLLREGYLADVVIFDPETVGDNATFEDSHQLSTGIRDVWVNGQRVLDKGVHTGATPGRIVRGPATANQTNSCTVISNLRFRGGPTEGAKDTRFNSKGSPSHSSLKPGDVELSFRDCHQG